MHSQTASSDGSELQNRPDSNMYKYDGQYAGPQDNDTYQLQTTNYNLTSDRIQLKFIIRSLTHIPFTLGSSLLIWLYYISNVSTYYGRDHWRHQLWGTDGWRGGLVVGRRTCDLVVTGSRPGHNVAA